jgi:DNA-binding IclR family transcriptional regulator
MAANGVAAVDRAFAIISAVTSATEPVSLARIAADTGLYKSTVLRLLGSIQAAGYVSRLAGGQYVFGPAIGRLSSAYERLNPLRHHVVPVLEALIEQGSESASFHIPSGTQRLCLYRADSAHATLDRISAGDLLPLERGAAGRVLLAFTGSAQAGADAVRAQCFAQSSGEREAGCSGIAAPVLRNGDDLAGALSLSGPSERFTAEMVATWRPRLIAAARELSHALGGEFPLAGETRA